MRRGTLRKSLWGVTLALAIGGAGGCNGLVTGKLADALGGSGTGFASDDDPELVAGAVPFALKTMEQLLPEQPKHVGLLTSLTSGFTQYGYAFVQQDADRLEDKDITLATAKRIRARRLYLRARDYGLRGLEVNHEGLTRKLLDTKHEGLPAALAPLDKDDLPLLYWTAAAWALAISDGKDNMPLVAQLPSVEAMMTRALAIDESWDEGSIHEFWVAYDGGRSEADGGGAKKAQAHLDRARALSHGKKLGGLVSYAESVSVSAQDKATFRKLLDEVVAFDADTDPPHRLANLIAQQRARWLLERQTELFAE